MNDLTTGEPANDPQDLERLLVARENAGDVTGMTAFSLATNNRSKSWGSLAGSLVVKSLVVTLRLSGCVALYLYYCAVLLLSYYVVPFLSYCVERGLIPPARKVRLRTHCMGRATGCVAPNVLLWTIKSNFGQCRCMHSLTKCSQLTDLIGVSVWFRTCTRGLFHFFNTADEGVDDNFLE